MRLLLSALLATTALPAFADTIPATSQITAVTVYPDGAKITRKVTFTAPSAGTHELLITDLPAGTDPGAMQLSGSEGLAFGAYSLRNDRMPPRDRGLTPAQEEAKAAVEAAEATVRDAQASVAEVQARISAAKARAAFLASFNGAVPDNATPESLRAMAEMVGAETLASAEAVAAATRDLWPAQKALEKANEVLADAQAAYDALPSRDQNYTALSVAIDAADAGENSMTVTHYIQGASWRPSYELYLTRKDEPKLKVNRAVLVSQYTGEDWSGVDLTLSSSRPSEQAAPSVLWPEYRRVEKPQPPELLTRKSVGSGALMDMAAEASIAAPAPISAIAGLEGDTVVYSYPRAVDIAAGVEDLRLPLDELTFDPKVIAVAVPRHDRTAFVEATFTNTSTEPLLPGTARLFREGVLVGSTQLEIIAAGEEAKIAFGAIDGLRIRRDMPVRDSGQRGVFTTSNEQTETAVLKIENLGQESWPVRVIDQMPYSEQQELKITLNAAPSPDVVDLDGQRGILAWDFELPGGEKKEITLAYTLSWPEGMELR